MLIAEVVCGQESQHGGYFSPILRLTNFNNQLGYIGGGRGMWVINSHLSIGGGFYGLINSPNAHTKTSDGKDYLTDLTYGGLEFEYIIYPLRKAYISLSVLCAGAGIKINPPSDNYQKYYGGDFLIMEPMLTVGYIFGEYTTFQIGISYRSISEYTIYYDFQKNSLEGLSANLAFTFGKFW